MNPMVEAGTKAILDAPMCKYHQAELFPVMSLADIRTLHEAVLLCTNCAANRAAAAWTAGVEKMTDRQVYDLGPACNMVFRKREPFDCENAEHGVLVKNRRRALLALVERPTGGTDG